MRLTKPSPKQRFPWFGAALLLTLAATAAFGAGRSRPVHGTISREYFEARSLFEKLWEPGTPSPSGGDGVGPLYNERSCVGCHHLGGTGGAGPNSNNVTILAAVPTTLPMSHGQLFVGELEELHPGFRNHTSIVLHHHATIPADEKQLERIGECSLVQTRDDVFQLARSSRSTPALFGSGLIDAIPDAVLLAAEARKFPAFPEIKGRVSRLNTGALGRFGWKGQTASLEDFVMAACANELGLEVRGHHQPSLLPARAFDPKALHLDLTDDDCQLLIKFVGNLPAPVVEPMSGASHGRAIFEAIGCATCHAPTLGSVRGLYSDLLLHDLGARFLSFGGGYGGGSTRIVEGQSQSNKAPSGSGEAAPTEWRTTPLWGVADSPPYLHDGRAATLHDAIVLHGGEAEATTKRYMSLSFDDRQALLAFLHGQRAPIQPGRLRDWAVRGSQGKSKRK